MKFLETSHVFCVQVVQKRAHQCYTRVCETFLVLESDSETFNNPLSILEIGGHLAKKDGVSTSPNRN